MERWPSARCENDNTNDSTKQLHYTHWKCLEVQASLTSETNNIDTNEEDVNEENMKVATRLEGEH